ncbi:type I restriction enzyme [Klebsiella pneumoniae]|uniref:site-specific DNA-methyltransferase (adenine-specific) n=1 Tax=Klebsiella pneumoniae TaxID=573 RepID=A0A377VB49_KLEPN|nr:type I restriction enzyme [Klebsiella pneumoniae]
MGGTLFALSGWSARRQHQGVTREENIFIWCFFLAVVELAMDADIEAYQWVKYLYIDDPISSLDEHNAIAVANHLAQLLKRQDNRLKTVISTHHTLFFNVLCNELGKARRYVVNKHSANGGYLLRPEEGDTPFFHHVAALAELYQAAQEDRLFTHHFNMLRTILEKTASFHGHKNFSVCIKQDDDDPDGILHARLINILSHGNYSLYEPQQMLDENKAYFKKILNEFLNRYPFNPDLFPQVPEAATAGYTMTEFEKQKLGKILWAIADKLRGAMNADDFRDYMLAFLFLRYLSDNYEAAAQKELGSDYPRQIDGSVSTPLQLWYESNYEDVPEFEKQMRRKVHYVIEPQYLWGNIAEMARKQDDELLRTLQKGFKYIEEESFASTFRGLFSEINLASDKLGKTYIERNARLCKIIAEIAKGLVQFSTDSDTLGDAYEYLIGQFAAGSAKGRRVLHAAAVFQTSCRPSSRWTVRSLPRQALASG